MGYAATELTWRWWRVKWWLKYNIGRRLGRPPTWNEYVIHVCDRVGIVAEHVGLEHDHEQGVRMLEVMTAWLANFQHEPPDDADIEWLLDTERAIAIAACRGSVV